MVLRPDIERVRTALAKARELLSSGAGMVGNVEIKPDGDPVTAADRAVNAALKSLLPHAGEGWLSEESAEDYTRLSARRVWIVDPLDGTREFIAGIPEWCVSVALVVDGQPVVGGVCNPATGETFIGAVGLGVTLDGREASVRGTRDLAGAEVLASRSEFNRGEWSAFTSCAFSVRPCGSIAYKLALVAVGRCDATWTLVPKLEWDVAGGVALVRAAGGAVWSPDGTDLIFNQRVPRLLSLAASAPGIASRLRPLLRSMARRQPR